MYVNRVMLRREPDTRGVGNQHSAPHKIYFFGGRFIVRM